MNGYKMGHWMAVPPGLLLLMEIRERGYSRKSFAKRLGIGKREFNAYIKGKKNIAIIADKISMLLGISSYILVNLQASYEEERAYIMSLKGHKRRGGGVYSKW